MILTVTELAWAAGLFDGEGCFTESRGVSKPGRVYYQHRAKLNMVDEHVVRRFHEAVGGLGTVIYVPPREKHHRPQYQWSVSRFELFQAVVALLWVFLSDPKKHAAVRLLHNAAYRGYTSIDPQDVGGNVSTKATRTEVRHGVCVV